MNEIQKAISKVHTGLIIQLVGSVVLGLFGIIFTIILVGTTVLSNMTDNTEDFMNSIATNYAFSGAMVILLFLAAIVSIISYSLYHKGTKSFSTFLDPLGKTAASQMALSAKLTIIGMLVGIAGFVLCAIVGAMTSSTAAVALIIAMGVLVCILCMIGFIFNVIGMINLKYSSTLNELGQVGARQISTAGVLLICQVFVNFIPVIGTITNVVISILYWVFVLSGWSKIKRSFAE